jgi:superfamily II helicase
MNSPSYDIFKIIKNNNTTIKILIYKIKKKKILDKRKKDLINQGLIKKNIIELTYLGKIVAIFFVIIKKIFNIKLEG